MDFQNVEKLVYFKVKRKEQNHCLATDVHSCRKLFTRAGGKYEYLTYQIKIREQGHYIMRLS